jgi:hypothetical protein
MNAKTASRNTSAPRGSVMAFSQGSHRCFSTFLKKAKAEYAELQPDKGLTRR